MRRLVTPGVTKKSVRFIVLAALAATLGCSIGAASAIADPFASIAKCSAPYGAGCPGPQIGPVAVPGAGSTQGNGANPKGSNGVAKAVGGGKSIRVPTSSVGGVSGARVEGASSRGFAGSRLASTGFDVWKVMLVGGLLVACGAGFWRLARRPEFSGTAR